VIVWTFATELVEQLGATVQRPIGAPDGDELRAEHPPEFLSNFEHPLFAEDVSGAFHIAACRNKSFWAVADKNFVSHRGLPSV